MGHSIATTLRTTDAELLEASRRGERDAFGELVGRYQRVVSAVSYSRTRDRALGDDVAQETFIAAWRQLDQLREPSRLRSWLCGIARNIARKASRKSAREVAVDDDDLEAVARDNPFDNVSEAQAERVVGEALARVPETYRDVLVLYYQEGLSIREVSEALGISEAAAMQRLSRGRQYLANGVNALVEKSLRKGPRRDLVAGVLAAVALIAPSHASASTTSKLGGSKMFKLIAAAALVAAGTTTAVVIHQTRASTSEPAPVVATAQPKAQAAPRAAKPPAFLPRAQAQKAQPVDENGNPIPPHLIAPEPDEYPSIDDATIARLELTKGPSRGPATAPITITMFTDLQCKYCGKSHGTLDQLFDEYPGKLRLVIKQMPVHKTAELGAEAALAADAQGKFWELDNLMIANHEDLSKDAILALAQQGGLDVARLKTDLENHTYAGALAADKAAASELEITGTPTFVINGRKVVGALPIEELRKSIEASIAEKQ